MPLELDLRYYRWYPPEAHLGYAVEHVRFDRTDTAFLLVDVYCPPPEHLFLQGMVTDRLQQLWYQVSVECIGPSLQAARGAGLPIVYVTNSGPRVALGESQFADKLRQSLGFEMEEAFTEPTVDPREYHQGEEVQLRFPAALEPQPDDYYIRKHVYSGFFDTRLDTLLRNLQISNLICVGFVANACLLFTIADALYRNYKVVLLRDCTLASELPDDFEELRQTQYMIQWIETIIGSTVTSSEFIAACEKAG